MEDWSMRIFVRCDRQGKILSTSKVYAMLENLPNPYAVSLKRVNRSLRSKLTLT